MCYYNGIKVTRTQWIRLMELEAALGSVEAVMEQLLQSGFTFENWPVVRGLNDGNAMEVVPMHWEFIPSWVPDMEAVKESRKKYTTLNAIGEELLEKKTFKDAALKRRCLVMSSGFYEWRHHKPEGAKKEIKYPYYITLPEKEYFFFAGIWQPWTDRSTGETMDTFAIVTTKANTLMEQVHNVKKRMPTILPEELAREWIRPGLSEDRIRELATYQFPAAEMIAYTLHKDFRTAENPQEEYHHPELPDLTT